MDMIFTSIAGIFIGALVFAATLNAGWRAFTAPGALRWTQGIACAATIAAMASLSMQLGITRPMGMILTLMSMYNVLKESGKRRIFPVVHFAVGMTLADGAFLQG